MSNKMSFTHWDDLGDSQESVDHQKSVNLLNKTNMKDQFMRIAMARLRSIYKFYPQRLAVAARMYREWLNRTIINN